MNTLSRLAAPCLAAIALLASPPLLAQSAAASDAVYRDLGGQAGLQKIVHAFHLLLLADERIKHTFVDTDMEHLEKMLFEQFCLLSGGPCKYSGKDMKTIHEDLKISNAQFNALAEDLQIAMENHGVPSSAQNKLLARLAPMQREIVTK